MDLLEVGFHNHHTVNSSSVQFLPDMDTECLPNQVEIMDHISPSGKPALIQSSGYVML